MATSEERWGRAAVVSEEVIVGRGEVDFQLTGSASAAL